jgi:hypothetical protein
VAAVSDNGWPEYKLLVLRNQERLEKKLDTLAYDVVGLSLEVTRLATAHTTRVGIMAALISLVASAIFAALAQRWFS